MKILHISYAETNAGWGAECFVDRALRELGHEVIVLDFKKYEGILAKKARKLNDFDVLFLQRGDFFPKGLLRASNRPCIFWASELISRCRDQDRLLYSGLFSHIFVHTEACKKTLVRKTAGRVEATVLTNAFDEKLHRKLPLKKVADVLFIGSMTERRERLLRELRKECEITCLSGVFGEDFVRAVNEARIVINIHSSRQPDTETRVFEVLGCGSFLLSEELSEDNPFIPGKHYIECGIANFPERIRYYLKHGEERERIAQTGHLYAVEHHSYYARTRDDILPVLERYARDTEEACWDEKRLARCARVERSGVCRIAKNGYRRMFRAYQEACDRVNAK